MSWISDIFGTSENKKTKDYSYEFMKSPEFAETTGAREDWASKLKEWGSMPGYGAIAPNWGDIWDTAAKRIKQYYWGGAGGQAGLSDKVKASAARRGVSESPALESELTKMGYQEAGQLGDLATQVGTKEAEFAETGRQNWLSSLMKMAGLTVPGQWATSGVTSTTQEPSGAAGMLGQLLGGSGGDIFKTILSGGKQLLGGATDWLSSLLGGGAGGGTDESSLGSASDDIFGDLDLSDVTSMASTAASVAPMIASFFSDKRLKKNIIKIGKDKNGFNIYSWEWKNWAKKIVKNSPTIGVIAQEIMKIRPHLVFRDSSGYLKVKYGLL